MMDLKNNKILLGTLFAGAMVGFFLGGFGSRTADPMLAALPDLQDIRRLLFPAIPEPTAPPAALPPPSPLPKLLPSAESYEAQIVSVVERANASVVSIIITKNLPIIEQYFENPFEEFGIELPFGFGIPQFRQRGVEKQEVGGGSGFIISSDGLIVTNRHVVQDEDADYTVLLNDGSRLAAKVIARDPGLDLAVLKINPMPVGRQGTGLTPLQFGDSDAVKLGSTAIAIGNALGEFRNTVSVGVISGLARTISASEGTRAQLLQNVIQTDAAINRGNSGGPLLNLRGEVIGVNTAVVLGAQNIGFTIPINQVKPAIEQVRRTGKITIAFLGVRYVVLTPQLKESNNLPVGYGALVGAGQNEPAVVKDSPAAKAGIRAGDIILEFSNEKITQDNHLATIIRKYKPGDNVALKVRRGDETITIRVTLSER